MDYEQLEQDINKIIELVKKLPDEYRTKCFEILVNALVSGSNITASKAAMERSQSTTETHVSVKFQIPIDVRAFCSQYSVPQDLLQKLFFVEDSEIRPIYKIEETKKSKAQMQVALLLALENALKSSKFEFQMETARQRCRDNKCYDEPNFKAHFKNNKELFKSLSDPEHVELSPDGKAELAETILAIAK